MKFIGVILFLLLITLSSSVNTDKSYGIDVSHYQGTIDWTKVKSWNSNKLKFVYIKATEGATWIDKTYAYNIKGAKKTDLLVGSYHYFRTTSSPQDQFNNFVSVVDKSKQDIVPLIDLEERSNWDKDTYHANLKIFLKLVEQHYGMKPMLYTVNRFYNENLSGKYNEYPILIGRYSQYPPILTDFRTYSIWQFTETGTVEGIPKKVDINVTSVSFNINSLKLNKRGG